MRYEQLIRWYILYRQDPGCRACTPLARAGQFQVIRLIGYRPMAKDAHNLPLLQKNTPASDPHLPESCQFHT